MSQDYSMIGEGSQNISFWIKASTRASSNELLWEKRFPIKLRVKAAPVEGQANEMIRALIAKRLKVPRPSVSIRFGTKSAFKKICIVGLSKDKLMKSLDAI